MIRSMRALLQGLILATLGGLVFSARAHSTPVVDPMYASLRAAEPDGRTLAVARPFTLERDVFTFEFERGEFHLLSPVEGRTWGAVFVGEGKFRLRPATEEERKHLAFRRGEPALEVLEDRFERLVLMFADGTFEELCAALGEPKLGAVDPAVIDAQHSLRDERLQELNVDLELRLLEDLLGRAPSRSGFFSASFQGSELPIRLVGVDPHGLSSLELGDLQGDEDSVLLTGGASRGLWYASERIREMEAGRLTPFQRAATAEHYQLAVEISPRMSVETTATVKLEVEHEARVLRFTLGAGIEIVEATSRASDKQAWAPIPLVRANEQAPAVAAILPESTKGGFVEVRFLLRGQHIFEELGKGRYAVTHNWYPRFGSRATYELEITTPATMQVVASGEMTRIEGPASRQTTRAAVLTPLPEVGFLVSTAETTESWTTVESAGFRVSGDRVKRTRALLQPGASGAPGFAPATGWQWQAGGSGQEGNYVQVPLEGRYSGGPASTISGSSPWGWGAAAWTVGSGEEGSDELAAARDICSAYFGSEVPRHEAVAVEEWSPGSHWPFLVVVPRRGAKRGARVSSAAASPRVSLEPLSAEICGHWWAQRFAPARSGDLWLEKGLAEFGAALAVQQRLGRSAQLDYFRVWRDRLLTAPSGHEPPITAGPLSIAARMPSAAASYLLPGKGAFVLQMLRRLSRDSSGAAPDLRFSTMLRDFFATTPGGAATTQAFKTVVERHMTPEMDLAGNGKMDWFFDQWVNGTEIPRLTHDLLVEKTGKHQYRIVGSIQMSDVSDGFRVVVPIYLEDKYGGLMKVAAVRLTGPTRQQLTLTARSTARPQRVTINALWDVLARD